MTDQEDLFTSTHARTDDPKTSKKAAKIASVRADSVKYKILGTLQAMGGVRTFEQIADCANIKDSNSWKRCSDLKREGRIIVFDENGIARSGASCSRYRITNDGLEAYFAARRKAGGMRVI